MDTPTRLAHIIAEARKYVLSLGLGVASTSLIFYYFSPSLIRAVQKHLSQQLAFYRVTEPFLAHVRFSISMALFTLMPVIVFCFWRILGRSFELSRTGLFLFVFFTCLLFYAGAGFCYFITLPFGVKFLLSYQSQQLKPVIAIGKFVSFVTIFVLAFGVIFELPMFMIFGAKSGICPRKVFEKNRRFAILGISIVAALLTPTPDVVNMALMALPLYMLYETGIIVLKILKIP